MAQIKKYSSRAEKQAAYNRRKRDAAQAEAARLQAVETEVRDTTATWLIIRAGWTSDPEQKAIMQQIAREISQGRAVKPDFQR